MSVGLHKFVSVAILCVLVLNVYGRPQETPSGQTTTEKSTWDKIKDGLEHGFNVAYDEVHCGFHKVKEQFKSHEHPEGTDPCTNKPYKQSTTPKSVDLVAEDVVPVTGRSS